MKLLDLIQVSKKARSVDRRTLPRCAREGCRRRVSPLPDGHTEHCYEHAPQTERDGFIGAWSKVA